MMYCLILPFNRQAEIRREIIGAAISLLIRISIMRGVSGDKNAWPGSAAKKFSSDFKMAGC
jgi:hypothetical protein